MTDALATVTAALVDDLILRGFPGPQPRQNLRRFFGAVDLDAFNRYKSVAGMDSSFRGRAPGLNPECDHSNGIA